MSNNALMWTCVLTLMISTLPAGGQTGATAEPETRTVRVPGTVVEFDLVRVPGGTTPDLWVSKTEVTWDLYDVYLYALDTPADDDGAGAIDAVSRPSKPYVPPDRGMGHAGHPAIGMTRHAAESFCEWLHASTGLDARLPTPEEFERLAVHDPESSEDHAWSQEDSDRTTHPVASKPANARGLHDMLGNVAEWVATDTKPIAMGGSYLDDEEDCTPGSTQRQTSRWNQSDPQIPKSHWWLADCSWVGFRFVIEVSEDDTHQPEE